MNDHGHYAKHVGKILASKLPIDKGEKIVVHHFTDFDEKIQVEVERRNKGVVSFSREEVKQ